MPPFTLPSPSGIAIGDAEAVGVHYVAASEKNPPLRIYYPAAHVGTAAAAATPPPPHGGTKEEVGYFQDTSPTYFLQGYLGVMMSRTRNTFLFQMGLICLRIVVWFFPLNYLQVPGVYQDATPAILVGSDDGNDNNNNQKKKLPLILFSHGLTGTGQENSILLSAWAKQGYVVVSVNHMDGSSSRVQTATGDDLWYDPGPRFTNYDVNFRPNQMKKRVKELLQAREWLLKTSPSKHLVISSKVVDWEKTIVAGFSYGAATTVLLATKKKDILPSLQAVILLDGWFHIDVTKSAGIEFNFPKEAFDDEISSQQLKEIPAIFINSQSFTKIPKLWEATTKLASRFNTNTNSNGAAADSDDDPSLQLLPQCHVIPDTYHNNFCDLVFWFPSWFLQKTKAIGKAEPRQAYLDIVRLTTDFFKKQQQKQQQTS